MGAGNGLVEERRLKSVHFIREVQRNGPEAPVSVVRSTFGHEVVPNKGNLEEPGECGQVRSDAWEGL
jgi:hypothetical protein